jgi:hypothetical protein
MFGSMVKSEVDRVMKVEFGGLSNGDLSLCVDVELRWSFRIRNIAFK